MKLADIEEKAQHYFEWPDGVSRNSVTLTSAILFARDCVNEAVAAEREATKKLAIEFFYWWNNQPGTNTEQGYDTFIRQRGAQ